MIIYTVPLRVAELLHNGLYQSLHTSSYAAENSSGTTSITWFKGESGGLVIAPINFFGV